MADKNLVPCKACGKEIAKGVKKCPNCGKDQRNWFMRHKILSFIGAIIVLFIIGSALGGGDDTDTGTNTASDNAATDSKTEEAPKEKVYAVGEVVAANKLEITVSKFEEKSKVGDQYVNKQASEGGTFVAIQYTMKNVSDEPVGMFDYPTLNLVDEKGTEYEADLDASSYYAVETDIDNSKIVSDLNPGITIKDTEVYEISKESFAQGKWYIQIGDQKVQIK
ncbi:DUF4352 domain-containing protein [Bacillus dakarensis]|uniref:DUF4352 domain-containing protein n=1 Tax=Robertmurraya dakarensis TaxID=1926278 RepID=UPI0009809B72|nr:DUF4352 domain-containing protein [Bacillus dakarensis]